jgi:energy-coupling factor transporter ATP-binding protein EcfA2
VDFYRIKERSAKNGVVEIYPDFTIKRSEDLMIRGRTFYAIWDQDKGLWSTDEYDVQRLVDDDLTRYKDERMEKQPGVYQVKYLGDYSSSSWLQFRNYIMHLSDNSHQLDENLTFANTEVTRKDYVSHRLSYPLASGSYASYDELLATLYAPEEREKLEWAIGAIIAGDAKHIQKFLVLYGSAGTGKSTVLNIMQKLFEGYYTTFEAKALTGNNNSFATEVFRGNPLVAIQHDGDLSRIEDNTKLNSIVSHEEMTMNEKYKPSYNAAINAFLFMGTNKPVKITDAKSGIIRRLIDVQPTGDTVPPRKYQSLYSQIDFELGAIAWHCLEVYRELGKDYYSKYRPVEMMLQTDVFFNFIEASFDVFKSQDGVSVNQAYEMYKTFCEESDIEFKMPKYKMREELKNYFDNFDERIDIDGVRVRSWYSGFSADHFKSQTSKAEPKVFSLVMDETESIFDREMADCFAQYTNANETPKEAWDNVTTTLKELDTTQLHYVRVPLNHIVIDFDLAGADGEKSAERNLEAASQWPSTYAEYSKSGSGIHLHYNYEGDVADLSMLYEEGIEIKVFSGKTSLRRRLSKCNNVPVATINSGLPLKEKKPVIKTDQVKSERALRELIERNLRKEIHPGTKSSIDFIKKILDDAYESGLAYDVTNMRSRIIAFANNSTHHPIPCLQQVKKMQFKSEEEAPVADAPGQVQPSDDRVVYFDCEVFPNLFVVCWKYEGSQDVVRMINPSPQEIEQLLTLKLVGFNNRKYDNHILYARLMGYNNLQLYNLSQKIVTSKTNEGLFREAYDLSYADIYDYSSKKQGLKRFEIELGLPHVESSFPWDEPVPEDKWSIVVEYCVNDVNATEAVAYDRRGDFIARRILAELSGLSINASTLQHTSRIIFGNDRHPQEKFVYTKLDEMFPGYKYEFGKSYYRDEITGEGGYVYAEPGMYENVALLDVASMHPTSIEQLNLFGEYTQNFSDLKAARIAIKRKNYDDARAMLNGRLAPYLGEEEDAEALSYALKIVINIVYGLTSARFDNSFKDPRNVDNIVAKRGALFMINLKHEVQAKGFTVAHIKTDSIKIPNATPEIIQFVMDYGKEYGYDFEHEDTYERFCLVNDAVYIAKKAKPKPDDVNKGWTATGAQFQHPYVFKTLFSKQPIVFRDMCETKTVTTAMYLDFEGEQPAMNVQLREGEKHFVGRAGQFTPIVNGRGGGILLREKEGKFYAVTGTKKKDGEPYKWLESTEVASIAGKEQDIDRMYFDSLVNDAVSTISNYGDFEAFTA